MGRATRTTAPEGGAAIIVRKRITSSPSKMKEALRDLRYLVEFNLLSPQSAFWGCSRATESFVERRYLLLMNHQGHIIFNCSSGGSKSRFFFQTPSNLPLVKLWPIFVSRAELGHYNNNFEVFLVNYRKRSSATAVGLL